MVDLAKKVEEIPPFIISKFKLKKGLIKLDHFLPKLYKSFVMF
jgi:hypothetical protein